MCINFFVLVAMADDFFILLLSGEDAHHIEKEYKGARRLP
jgi:hypothetical protein